MYHVESCRCCDVTRQLNNIVGCSHRLLCLSPSTTSVHHTLHVFHELYWNLQVLFTSRNDFTPQRNRADCAALFSKSVLIVCRKIFIISRVCFSEVFCCNSSGLPLYLRYDTKNSI